MSETGTGTRQNPRDLAEKYEAHANAVGLMLNNFSFSEKEFCKQMGNQHNTLQQSFTRLCKAWIEHCATKEYANRADGRNEASAKWCETLVENNPMAFEQGLPMI